MEARLKDEDEYERKLEALQNKMLTIQQAYYHAGRRGIVAVEGWDAAGKGGMIRRLTEKLDPRGVKVWPIGPPETSEQGRHYLYRFWTKLPEPGTIAIFDRSWYGRVLVERVDKLASKEAWQRAYDEINDFERMLIDDGVRLAKVFLHVTPEEQLKRFAQRLHDPYKRWKLRESDIRVHVQWEDYAEAIEDMFDRTSTKAAPWTVIPANQKWYARIAAMMAITDAFARGIDITPPPIDPKVERAALRLLNGRREKKAKK
ncbi:MAG TPA: polyphosphate kinase [Alphaproteobacteria bacterium]|nr:polyphosphate kinase [Alphaproteobacteria bacterium]